MAVPELVEASNPHRAKLDHPGRSAVIKLIKWGMVAMVIVAIVVLVPAIALTVLVR